MNASIHPSLLERIQQSLGLSDVLSDEDLWEYVENRLPVSVLPFLGRQGISDDEIYRLVIPRRTLTHRKAKQEPLSREESDRVVRLARITSLSHQVFEDQEKARMWLHQPKSRFDGRAPMELLRTESGARLVEEMLYQIDHGLFA